MKGIGVLIVIVLMYSCVEVKQNAVFNSFSGYAFGTSYTISYEDVQNRDFSKEIDSIIYAVNKSLSTYLKSSDISKINQGDVSIIVDDMFAEVFIKSNRIYKETAGFFDPTVGVLVNAWGFGPGDSLNNIDTVQIDSLKRFVGFEKVTLTNRKISKLYPEIYFDFNAIAKGYGIDMIGRFLESKNCDNYLVEIGGEVRARGKSSRNQFWKIGLENPNTDGTRSIGNIVELNNESMATSGNYRKFKINKNGRKYVHTINPKTGYAYASDLLSATVIAELDCADVDGYATAFMAMGFEKSVKFLQKHSELKAHLIYIDSSGATQTLTSKGLLITNR
ncbi:MAG: FAD:protein FMN transferase [Flavobacteriaceae bacterium]|nr:FAD:protein FMN transferase [Flavobacteriaceae bacterium]